VSALALKYGSTTVRTLRDYYGSFAPHCADESELGEILAGLDVASLTQIIRDYKSGRLEQICQRWPDLTVSPPSCLPGGGTFLLRRYGRAQFRTTSYAHSRSAS
jgi:hypothetical protein